MKYSGLFLIIVVTLLFGEIMCLYRLVSCDFKPSYKAEVFYSISLVTGIGGITGYIDVGK